jgi:hypothetical protein
LAIAWSHPFILPLAGSLGDGRIAALGLPGWPAATIIDGVADLDSSVLVEGIDRAEGGGGRGDRGRLGNGELSGGWGVDGCLAWTRSLTNGMGR